MPSRLDILSPATIGSEKIGLKVDAGSKLLANNPITVNIDYSRADVDGGIVLPLIIALVPVSDPEKTEFVERQFKLTRPDSFTFTVERAGEYLIVARESAHNRWVGRVRLVVEGDPFTQIQLSERF